MEREWRGPLAGAIPQGTAELTELIVVMLRIENAVVVEEQRTPRLPAPLFVPGECAGIFLPVARRDNEQERRLQSAIDCSSRL